MNVSIFYLTSAIWISSEIYLNRFFRSGNSGKQSADKRSELYIWLTILVCTITGVIISSQSAFHIFLNEQLGYIGIGIIYMGIIFRFTAIKQLGKFFTVDVAIRKDHQLMQTGFYKYLRHPSYSGSLLSFLGFGISLNNWLSLAIVFVPTLAAFIYRMNIEEQVLAKQFGGQYSDYISKTKRILPYIY
jgi:protein-S-isoprenylcysteine O-methyltransferase Ste14